jgi:hypothetical protein
MQRKPLRLRIELYIFLLTAQNSVFQIQLSLVTLSTFSESTGKELEGVGKLPLHTGLHTGEKKVWLAYRKHKIQCQIRLQTPASLVRLPHGKFIFTFPEASCLQNFHCIVRNVAANVIDTPCLAEFDIAHAE